MAEQLCIQSPEGFNPSLMSYMLSCVQEFSRRWERELTFTQLSPSNPPTPKWELKRATLNIFTTLYGILAFRKKMKTELFQDIKVIYT